MKQIKIIYSKQDQALLDNIELLLRHYEHSEEEIGIPSLIRQVTSKGIEVKQGERLSPVYDELLSLQADVLSKMIPVSVEVVDVYWENEI